MTFENAAWAIDGAQMNSSLARRAEYAALGGVEGIVQAADLKVTALSVPGVGVQIAPGVGLLLNKYQTVVNETYVVSNPGVHTIPSVEMPGASGSARSFIVAVVVGDKDFSQVGHPFMGSDDPPEGEETTFQYVRPVLIQVSAGATTLPGAYPALPLARIDIPASTTTITNAMITDLRLLARPRQEQQLLAFGSPASWSNASPVYIPSATDFATWVNGGNVKVPSWAKRCIIVAQANSWFVGDHTVDIGGAIRIKLGTVVTPSSYFNLPIGNDPIRDSTVAAANFDVSSVAGQTVALTLQGYENAPASPTLNQRLKLADGSQVIFDIRFFEQ